MRAHFRFSISRYAVNDVRQFKTTDLIGHATFFCLVELPVRGVTRPPFPLLTKIRGLARETRPAWYAKSRDNLCHMATWF